MSSIFTKLIIQARKNAGLSQMEAAEKIGVALRTMANYESGRTPTDLIIVRMMHVYGEPSLGYAYLSTEMETGRMLLPQIRINQGLASGAMSLHLSIKKAARIYDRLEEICCDDKISHDEESDYKRCWAELDELMKNVLSMKYIKEKSLTAATVRP